MQRPMLAESRRAKDAALAARVIARPDEAILAAWRRFRPLVRWTLVKMLGPDDEDVRDLTQETFVQLYRSVQSLRSPAAIRSFAAGIAVRLALQETRRRRVRGGQVLVPGQAMLPLSSANADPEGREAMAGLVRVVAKLRPADRDMFVLRQILGFEQSEICAHTRMSISTVRRRLRRLQRRIDILTQADPALAAYTERAAGKAP
jgi:RNA polymerase sigma-70 factor, ECF subfamily